MDHPIEKALQERTQRRKDRWLIRPFHDRTDLLKTIGCLVCYLAARLAQQYVATSIDEMELLHTLEVDALYPASSSASMYSVTTDDGLADKEWIPGKWEFTRAWPDYHLMRSHRPWMFIGIAWLTLTIILYRKEAARLCRRAFIPLIIATCVRVLIASVRFRKPNSHMYCPTPPPLQRPAFLRALRLFSWVDQSCAGDSYMPEYVSVLMLLLLALYSLPGKRLFRVVGVMYTIAAFVCTTLYGYYYTSDILANVLILTTFWAWYGFAVRDANEDKWWARPAIWLDRVPSQITLVQWKKSITKELMQEQQALQQPQDLQTQSDISSTAGPAEVQIDLSTSPQRQSLASEDTERAKSDLAKRPSITLDPRGAQRRAEMEIHL